MEEKTICSYLDAYDTPWGICVSRGVASRLILFPYLLSTVKDNVEEGGRRRLHFLSIYVLNKDGKFVLLPKRLKEVKSND